MNTTDLRKFLLAGTAIVAVGAFATGASAADLALTGNSTWGTTAPVNAPTASDNVDLTSFNLLVDESDVTAIGAITDTGTPADGNVTFDSNAGDNASTTVTVGSASIGSGNFVVQATENTASANADATSVTVTGAISTTGNVTVTGGTNANNSSNTGDDATLTVGGDITAASIAVTDGADGAASLVLNGTSAQTITGAISGSGDVTISNTSTGGVTIATTSTTTGTFTNNGVLKVNSGTILTATTLAGTGSYVIGVTDTDGTVSASDFGRLSGTGTIALADTSLNVTGYVGVGSADILGTAVFDVAGVVTDNSALQIFTAATDGTITVTNASTDSITTSAATKAVADTLIANNTATGNLGLVVDSFAAAGTSTVNKVLEAAVTNVSGGAVNAGVSVANQTGAVTGTRLAALRSGDSVTSMSAGDLSDGVKVWGQAFGSTATQDERDGISGYDADTYGFIAGIDTETLAEGATVGLAVSYANTDVDSDALDNGKTDIDSYQVTLYGDYDINDRTYVSGQLGYIFGSNDVTRSNVGGAGFGVTGDFDSDTIVAKVELGHDYAVDGGLTLTPKASVNYVNYSADGYTETDATGAAYLIAGKTDLDVLELGLAVDATWVKNNADGSYLKPVLSAGVRHDLIGDEVETTNQFAGAGSAFKVTGFDPAQTTFDVGAGVTYFSTDNWELSADYNYEFKSDYDAHTGSLKAAYKF